MISRQIITKGYLEQGLRAVPVSPSRHHPCFRRDRFCVVAFDRSSPAYAGAGLRRLTSSTLLVIRNATLHIISVLIPRLGG
jgi:hypothetical protein